MASIVKRKSSYAVVYYYKNQNGIRKQKWESFKTFPEAEQRKNQIETNPLPFITPINTFSDLVSEYINLYGMAKWSYSTFSSNLALIQNYILNGLGPLSLTDITPRLLDRFFKDLQNQISIPTLLNIHKLIKSIFNQACKWNYMDKNPAINIILPKYKANKLFILDAEQIALLLNCCENDYLLFLCIQFAFACSMRKGEILALTWNDIDFEKGIVHITKELTRVEKKLIDKLHRKDIIYIFPNKLNTPSKTCLVLKCPKTQSSMRDVYIPKTLLYQLALYCQKISSTNHLTKKFPLIFSDSYGYPITDKVINDHLRKCLSKCGLPPVVFHSFRHSSVTYKLLITGGDIKSIQGDTGHSQINMITDVYGHILDFGRKRISERFDETFYSLCRPQIISN